MAQAMLEFQTDYKEQHGALDKIRFNVQIDEMKVCRNVRFNYSNDKIYGLVDEKGQLTFGFEDVLSCVNEAGDGPVTPAISHIVVPVCQHVSEHMCHRPTVPWHAHQHQHRHQRPMCTPSV